MQPIQDDQKIPPDNQQLQQTVKKESSKKVLQKRRNIILGIVILGLLIGAIFLFFSNIAKRGMQPGLPEQSLQSPSGVSPSSSTTNCQPNAILVNPCRAWIGAAAKGNPGIPGQTPPGSDLISQFTYFESLIGRPLDVFRMYHSPLSVGNSNSTLPFDKTAPSGKAEIQMANRPNTYVDINWDPSQLWSSSMPVAQGGDPAINTQIDQAATNIKTVAPHKIFLSVWHEANDHVSSGGTGCSHYNTSSGFGSPSQFVAAYQNIYNHFKADGVTNVVWVMSYASYAPNNCWVTQLWPGNQYVDWVMYDTYDRTSTQSWDTTVGAFYTFLSQNSSTSVTYTSKPWALGEFGTCSNTDVANSQQYFIDAKNTLDANKYPNLKMYLIYADSDGPLSGSGCLTDFDANRRYDPQKQTIFNQFYTDPLFTAGTPILTSFQSTPPTVTLGSTFGKGKHRGKHNNQNRN